jgi:hypothetical protein
VGTLLRHRFDPTDLPLYSGWDRVKRCDNPAELRAIYQRAARGSTGLIDRPEAAWRFLADPNASVYVHRDPADKPTGYVITQVRAGPAADRLRVIELVALNRGAHDALLGWLSAQRDQFREVTYDALAGEALDRRLRHPRRPRSGRPRGLWFETATMLRGPMLRLLSPNAVQGGDAGVGFGLLDTEMPDSAGRWVGGRRVGGPADALKGEEVMGPGEAADRLVHGRLPGQLPPPEGWCPIPFGEEFRLLDEF